MNKFILFFLLIFSCIMITSQPSYAQEEACPSMSVLTERWSKTCYSCIVVVQLLDAFMNGAAMVEPVTSDAGKKILIVGLILWVGFWGLKNLMSFSQSNGAQMLNELVIMGFKILVAWTIISLGISTMINLAVGPILNAGADYANTILEKSSPISKETTLNSDETFTGNEDIISAAILNKIMLFSKTANNKISTIMIIGSGLMCFAEENQWFTIPVNIITYVKVPNLFILFSGAIIWCIGFMLTLSICYYLLDMSFRMGFVVIILPIAVSLWPFNLTKGKISECIKMVINATGLFVFLAITVSYGLLLIDNSLESRETPDAGGVEELFAALEADDKAFIDKRFEITGNYFFIIMFAFVYAFKLIGKSQDFNNKFFPSGTGLESANPMHHAATAITARASKLVTAPVKLAGDIAGHQIGMAAAKVGSKAAEAIFKPKQFAENTKKDIANLSKKIEAMPQKIGNNMNKLGDRLDNFGAKSLAKGIKKQNEADIAINSGKKIIADGKTQGGAIGVIKVASGSLQVALGNAKKGLGIAKENRANLKIKIGEGVGDILHSAGDEIGNIVKKPEDK